MGVYINMEMPKEGFVEILVRDDGTVQQTGQSYRIDGTDYYTPYVGEMPTIYKAVPVPPHGDLIDKDATMNAILEERGEDTACWFACIVNDMPAVIPSDKAEEGE